MRDRIRRCALVLLVLLPVALGPAFAPLALLWGEPDHVCACGMKAGTCGCPECALLDGRMADAVQRIANRFATLRSCDEHDRATMPTVPPFIVPSGFDVLPSELRGCVMTAEPLPLVVRDDGRPPTPPPRDRSA